MKRAEEESSGAMTNRHSQREEHIGSALASARPPRVANGPLQGFGGAMSGGLTGRINHSHKLDIMY